MRGRMKAEEEMPGLLFYLIQFLWGLPQNLLGALLSLLLSITASPRRRYGRTFVVFWPFLGSLSLGIFLFLERIPQKVVEEEVLQHEGGHTLQSLLLGPLYLLVIGLPSLLWAGLFNSYRRKKGISYYAFYTERWANHLARKYGSILHS